MSIYENDTFFNLSAWAATGVVSVSLLLATVVFWVLRALISKSPAWAALPIAFVMFWGFVWLSPQIYYIYYIAVFDDLPVQWVIGAPPDITKIIKLLTFNAKPSLADHSAGLFGWALIGYATWRLIRKTKPGT